MSMRYARLSNVSQSFATPTVNCAKEYPDLFRFATYIALSALVTSTSAVAPSFHDTSTECEVARVDVTWRLNLLEEI